MLYEQRGKNEMKIEKSAPPQHFPRLSNPRQVIGEFSAGSPRGAEEPVVPTTIHLKYWEFSTRAAYWRSLRP